MKERLITFLALVLYANLAVNVFFHLFREPVVRTGPNRTSLAAGSERPGATRNTVIPEGKAHVLRVALLLAAPNGDTTAIGDVKDVPYASGDWLDVPLAVTRPLLPEFGNPTVAGSVRLQVFGPAGDLDVFWFDRENLHLDFPLVGGAGRPPRAGGGWKGRSDPLAAVFYPERWVVRRGEPLVCLAGRQAAALAFLVLSPEEAAATDGGRLAFWRDRFRGTGKLPLIDREDATAAIRSLRPIRDGMPLPETTGVAATALLNGALGAWTLGDLAGLDALRRQAAARPDLLRASLGSLRHDRLDEEWTCTDAVFALQLLDVLPFDFRRVRDAVTENISAGVHYFDGALRLRNVDPPFRAFRMLDDPIADAAAAGRLADLQPQIRFGTTSYVPFEYDLGGGVGRYAFEFDPPNDRPAVVAAWEKAREPYLAHLDPNLRRWAKSRGLRLALMLLAAAVGIGVALVPRGDRPPTRLTRAVVGYFYALTAAELLTSHFFAGWLIAGVGIPLFGYWLRGDLRHPWWERVAVALTMASLGVHLVLGQAVPLVHPLLAYVGGIWSGFAWLVVGRMVLVNPRDRDSRAFRTFLLLHVFLSVQTTAAVVSGQLAAAAPALQTTLGVAGAALLWFCLEGPISRMVSRVTGRGG